MKRVFIVHGWSGSPEEGWFPWLKNKLEEKGFEVFVPAMPNPDVPTIDAWVSCLRDAVGVPDEETYFVGHSIGCQTIMRYLASLPQDIKVGGVIFVAPWFTLMNLSSKEESGIAKPWLETPIDLEKVKSHSSFFITFFSDDDPVVPLDNQELFKQNLNAEVFVEHEKGHLGGDDHITEFPTLLDKLLAVIQKS